MAGEVVDRGDDWQPTDGDQTDAERHAAEAKAHEDAANAEKAAEDAKTAKDAEDAKAVKDAADAKAIEDAKTDDEKAADKKAADEKAAAEKDDKKKDTRLPLSRHKEILDQERARREAVEAELAKYKQAGEIKETNEEITKSEDKLLALEKEYAKALVDGKADEAAATMAQIRKLERSINEQTSQVREAAAEARAVERVRYDTTVERLEAAYPQLDPDHADFDKEQTGEVLELKEAYQLKGYTPSQALQKAVKMVFKTSSAKQEKAVETEARVDADAVAKQRKADAKAKADAALKTTPPSLKDVGKDSDKAGGGKVSAADVMKMSSEEFNKLDDETLARMRGDLIA